MLGMSHVYHRVVMLCDGPVFLHCVFVCSNSVRLFDHEFIVTGAVCESRGCWMVCVSIFVDDSG
jgi:hypothetical protein